MANEIVVIVKGEGDANLDPVRAALENIGETARRSTDQVNRGFERARDSLGRFVKQGQGAGRALDPVGDSVKKTNKLFDAFMSSLGAGLEGAASNVFKFSNKVGELGFQMAATQAAGTAASGGINLLVQAVGALAIGIPVALAGFVALAPALLSVVGVAGAATSALFGVGIALATLKIGFGGIGDALTAHGKQMAGAGGAARNTAEQEHQAAIRIRDATRNLVDAKKRELDAAKDVNKARQNEIERLEDLKIALQSQKVSQAEAAQALVEAKEKNRRAQEAGSAWEKTEAKNALDRAQAEYDAQTEKLDDLTKEKKKADKEGINGSDQVQDALKRQTQAHEQVLRAQEQLTEAQRKQTVASAGATGGVNAFNDAMAKLSPNAQKLVRALLDIQERFQKIKRQVQDRLLAGFDKEVTELADKWLPRLDDILGKMADKLNKFGKTTMQALGDDDFIDNIEKMGDDFGFVIDDMGVSVDSLIDAFGRIGAAAGPVLRVISGRVRQIFVWFDKWIKRADETGQLDSFMQKAADMLDRIFEIGEKVFKIIGKIIAIIFPSSEEAADSVFTSVEEALDKVSKWLDDPSNQKDIKEFIKTVKDFLNWMIKTGIPAIAKFSGWILKISDYSVKADRAMLKLGNQIVESLNKAYNWAYNATARFFNWFTSAAYKTGNALYGAWTGLKNGFRDVVNWIIGAWNNLSFPLPGILGGGSIDTPNIRYMASGGIHGGLAMVGERGRELIRMPQGSSVIPNGATERMMSEGAGGGSFTFAFAKNGNKLIDAFIESLRLYISSRGGNVQVALGKG